MWRVLTIAAFVVAADAARAHACTCAPPSVPERGIEVPVNMKDVMANVSAPSLVEKVSGIAVPVGDPIVVWGPYQTMRLVPIAALKPNTEYTFAGYLDFFTSSEVDTEPPGPVELEDITFTYEDRSNPNGTCGVNELDIGGRIVIPPDAVTVWARFERAGVEQLRLLNVRWGALHTLGTSVCNVKIDLEIGETYQLHVWARDLAGNEGPVAKTTVTIREGCLGCGSTQPSSWLLTALGVLGLLVRRHRRKSVS